MLSMSDSVGASHQEERVKPRGKVEHTHDGLAMNESAIIMWEGCLANALLSAAVVQESRRLLFEVLHASQRDVLAFMHHHVSGEPLSWSFLLWCACTYLLIGREIVQSTRYTRNLTKVGQNIQQ